LNKALDILGVVGNCSRGAVQKTNTIPGSWIKTCNMALPNQTHTIVFCFVLSFFGQPSFPELLQHGKPCGYLQQVLCQAKWPSYHRTMPRKHSNIRIHLFNIRCFCAIVQLASASYRLVTILHFTSYFSSKTGSSSFPLVSVCRLCWKRTHFMGCLTHLPPSQQHATSMQ